MISHRITRAAACCALVLALGGANLAPVAAANEPVNVGIINSTSGPLGAYGLEYDEGFKAGLAYATHGTGEVNGHKIVVSYNDDAGDGAKAVATAKDLIGQGTKIIAGTVWSGIALQMAPLAQENKILYVSGPAAVDGVSGSNRNTFRSGRQSIRTSYRSVRCSAPICAASRCSYWRKTRHSVKPTSRPPARYSVRKARP